MSTIKMIYDSTCDIQDYEGYLEGFLEETRISKSDYETTPQVWEMDFDKYIYREKECEYNDEITNITYYENTHNKKTYVIKGFIGLWHGTYEGGKIIKGMKNVIIKCHGGEEYFKFYMDGKIMKFMVSHHDGTNNFYIKELTERGEKFYETHKEELNDKEMVEKLYNDRHLSRHVTIWHDMYGM